MTASNNFIIEPISYDPDQYKPLELDEEPVHIINVELNGRIWKMPIELYNQNIESGKTKFITTSDKLVMITPEQYQLLEEAMKTINGRKN